MTAEKIAKLASELTVRREGVRYAEGVLRECVELFCNQSMGTATSMAHKLGVSIPYMSRIRHGKKGMSDKVVERLARLK